MGQKENKNSTKDKIINEEIKQKANQVRQNSTYKEGKPVPDNNMFFEERSNPLCSKGN